MIARGRAFVFSLMLASVAGVSAAPPSSLAAAPQTQPQASETATQFYLRWRSTALSAKSMDEIMPFWMAEIADQFSMEPDAVKADTLPMIKRLYGAQTDVKVMKETATPTGATLSLEGKDSEQKPIVSRVEIIKENGAWKMTGAVEQWKPKRTPIPD